VSFDPLDLTSKRIADPDLPVTAHERSVIEHAYDIQHRNWEIHAAATAPGFVHGDFSAHNVLDTATGPVVIDFENTGQGNMLWDLVRIVHAPTRFANSATQAGREYAATLLDVYTRVAGPVDTGSLEDLISVVDLIGAVWTVAARSHDPWFEHESVIRLASLEDPTRPPDWSPR
jgi:aminoglycoside phosphotransferase (APT) family kinase protein